MLISAKEITEKITPLVQTLTWGAIAMAVVLPVAAAVGNVVAGKIEKK